MDNIATLNKVRIEFRVDGVRGTAEAFVDRAFLARGSYTHVRDEVKKAEYNIYEVDGEFPIIFLPSGRFADSGEWIPKY